MSPLCCVGLLPDATEIAPAGFNDAPIVIAMGDSEPVTMSMPPDLVCASAVKRLTSPDDFSLFPETICILESLPFTDDTIIFLELCIKTAPLDC